MKRKPRKSRARPILLLKYQDTLAARRWMIRKRLLAVLVLLGAAKLLLITVGDRAWTGVLSQFWQERCLSYQLPDDRIAYIAAPQGLVLPPYLGDFSRGRGSTWSGTIGASPYPVELAEFQKLTAPPSAIPWESLPGPVFLHGLQDGSGRERMVTVYALANNPPGWWTLIATVRDPIGLRPAPKPPLVSTSCWPLPKTASDMLMVFAGQPDRSNASRFTLRVRLNGVDQTITGLLRDDATVDFTSSTGLTPWSTNRTGALLLPQILPAIETCDNVLLPVD